VDLRDSSRIAEIVDLIRRDVGPVDILANVAGAWHDDSHPYGGQPLWETSRSEIDEILDVEIRGPMLLTAGLLPSMIERRAGHILNISSVFPEGGAGWLHHFVAKKALEELTRGLAQEVAPYRVQVNCLALSDVATESFRRFFPEAVADALKVHEVTDVALTLLSDSGRHITGQVIAIGRAI
jgi:3-oxoacyl-[acyl-carrier protein] reductase